MIPFNNRKNAYKVGLPTIWLVGFLFGLATVLFALMAHSNEQGLSIVGIITLSRWYATVSYWVLAGLSMGVVLMVLALTIRRIKSCPYCGKPLRMTGDKHCVECGADWSGHM
ncbi:MAG: hypothetical protein ABSA77_04450 [Thermoguttaceae bacterium]|jgi:hypothetical protein